MTDTHAHPPPCLLLTATIQVKNDMVFTARKDTISRLQDYKQALTLWLAHPEVQSLVLVENSGSDLSELREIASRTPEKTVEFLSFTAPPFDGALGKGYGEMICLEHALKHSRLLARSPQFIKATGRYYLANASRFLRYVQAQSQTDVICDLLLNLTWADSRVFAGSTDFLRTLLFPLREQINDSQGINFENILARAVHVCMARGGSWAEPPFPLEIQGISGSQDRGWRMSLRDRLAVRLRHRLFSRYLASAPR